MEYDVTVNRGLYIGGSDIPCIMGLSKFKTRYELLLEKAGLRENDFTGNRYTEYGNVMEPKIRAYINEHRQEEFEPNKVIDGDIRCHTDGFNGACVLEIKTTSDTHETVDEYRVYLVQLLLYMDKNKVKAGLLAVYDRPEDFNTDFDPERLSTFDISLEDYVWLLEEVKAEIERFRTDLKRLKENPLLSEEDFQPDELVVLSQKAIVLENQMAQFKALETQYNELKRTLFEAMQKHNVKSWQMPNGTRITRVDGTEAKTKTVIEFDTETFKEENPALYENHLHEVEKKTVGRSGYVKITMP